MVDEPVKTEFLSMAQAAKSCGGKVLCTSSLLELKFIKTK